MSNLVLDSLEIKNFRAFKHLRIEKLGRVNLIVGKNNVGKTSVLEALWIYAEQGEPALLYRLLSQRDEITIGNNGIPLTSSAHERASSFSNLFFGRNDTREPHFPIHIGSAEDADLSVKIDVNWPITSQIRNEDAVDKSSNAYPDIFQQPLIALYFGTKHFLHTPFSADYIWGDRIVNSDNATHIKSIYVGAMGVSPTDLAVFWDAVALSDLELEVTSALMIIAPEIIAVNLVGGELRNRMRIPKVRTEKNSTPITLRSMGEGMNRMLGIALALVNAKDGMLLIDEVDTGLHYSVLPDMWKLIFEVAHRLNVQVFATSHSWDCIQAFQQAAADSKEAEGVLIRLEQRKDGIGAVTFDEDELAIVTREQIEVR